MEGAHDLHLLLAGAGGQLLHEDSEVLALTILGQDRPACGDGDLILDLVKGLDLMGADLADWAHLLGETLKELAQAVQFL